MIFHLGYEDLLHLFLTPLCPVKYFHFLYQWDLFLMLEDLVPELTLMSTEVRLRT